MHPRLLAVVDAPTSSVYSIHRPFRSSPRISSWPTDAVTRRIESGRARELAVTVVDGERDRDFIKNMMAASDALTLLSARARLSRQLSARRSLARLYPPPPCTVWNRVRNRP